MQRATLGKSGSEAASQLQGRIARGFSSNSLVNTVDMMAAFGDWKFPYKETKSTNKLPYVAI